MNIFLIIYIIGIILITLVTGILTIFTNKLDCIIDEYTEVVEFILFGLMVFIVAISWPITAPYVITYIKKLKE